MTPGLNWGAMPSEQNMALPCDALIPDARTRADRAISICASPKLVFAWLCQLRVAPYSYDVVDNFGRRSPRRRNPDLARLEAGQRFMTFFALQSFVDGERITLRSNSVAVTYAVRPEAAGARLHVRVVFGGPWLVGRILALGDVVMMRKQLLTMKSLAEDDPVTVQHVHKRSMTEYKLALPRSGARARWRTIDHQPGDG